MAGESMSYPLRYGYSLVGRVARCGAGVDPEKFLGKLVFAFSPHSSWVLADADGVMLVPEVSVCFMPLRVHLRWLSESDFLTHCCTRLINHASDEGTTTYLPHML